MKKLLLIVRMMLVAAAVYFGGQGITQAQTTLPPCPADKPLRDGISITCLPCDTDKYINMRERNDAECTVCPNRKIYGEGYGRVCDVPCSANKPVRDDSGRCHSCDEEKAFFLNKKNAEAACNLCPGRVLYDMKEIAMCATPCPNDKPLMGIDGTCYACDMQEGVKMALVQNIEARCEVCQGRKMYGDMCAIPCPQDKPLMDNNGKCHACDTDKKIYVSGAAVGSDCAVCPNRKLYSIDSENRYDAGMCVIPCPQDKPLMDNNGKCHSCDMEGYVYVDRTAGTSFCAACPGHKFYRERWCAKPCPKDKPLRGHNGICHACDTAESVQMPGYAAIDDNLGMCRNACPNRGINARDGTGCVLDNR